MNCLWFIAMSAVFSYVYDSCSAMLYCVFIPGEVLRGDRIVNTPYKVSHYISYKLLMA